MQLNYSLLTNGDSARFFYRFTDVTIMYLCKGPYKTRVYLMTGRFHSNGEIFRYAREPSRHTQIWLEYGPNLYQPIYNDNELRFACHLLQGEVESNISDPDHEQYKRDLADQQHTADYEAQVARMHRNTKTRVKSEPTQKGIVRMSYHGGSHHSVAA